MNGESERFRFHYELDGGDEAEQEGFDESKYIELVTKNKEKWLSMIPRSVVDSFPSLGKHPNMMM